jgi:hypothetical protein
MTTGSSDRGADVSLEARLATTGFVTTHVGNAVTARSVTLSDRAALVGDIRM